MAMHSVNVRDKGQITLPADIRNELGLNKGDRLLVERRGKAIMLVLPEDLVDHTAGSLAEYAKNVPTMTPAEMREAAADAIAEENLETLQQIERDHASR